MIKNQKYPEIETLIEIAKVLDRLKIPYYVSGGYAVSIYGRPRFTADLDIIIKMSMAESGDFAKRMEKLFPTGYVDKDQIDNALKNYGEFNIIDPETGLKIDFFVPKQGEFEKSCFEMAKTKDVGYRVKFTSPENLIISKLIWYRESLSTRHLEDIEGVLAASKINQKYLHSWVKKLGLEKEWKKLGKKKS